jgi:N-acetyl sugar amidotransferase
MDGMKKRLQCVRCLYTVFHPLGLVLDNEGICSGCRIHEEKDVLDWDARWKKLKDLVAPYKVKSGLTYDCIVPVTGGNDSYFIVHTVKNLLQLNPLLVTYNKYFNSPLGIRNLANLRIKFNCDILIQNVNPKVVRNITRTTLRELGSMYWPCIAGQTVYPVQIAVRYKVPLIIWGAHQGLEQVGMFSHEHEVEMTRRYRKDHDLMGMEADDLISIFDTLNEDDIWQYRYPDDNDLQAVGVRGIYLGNYLRWDPKAQHEQMVRQYGYMGARLPRTFDTYDHVDCYNFMDVHDYIKFVKHGYSKVTDHASREIRHRRLDRKQALVLVQEHEVQPPVYLDKFCEWMGLDQRAFRFVINQHRSRKVCEGVDCIEPYRLDSFDFSYAIAPSPHHVLSLGFQTHSTLSMNRMDGYVTYGKGYPD